MKRLGTHHHHIKGFTLLELCVVIFIIVLFLGISLPMMSTVYEQQNVKEPAQKLLIFAKTARRSAVDEQHPFEVILSDSGYVLNSVTADPKTGKSRSVQKLSYKLPSNVAFTVERWGEKSLHKPKNEKWIFQPSGIMEPVRVRFQCKKSWYEFTFHPLTAAPQDEESNIES